MANDKGLYSVKITGQGFDELSNEKKTPYFFLNFNILGKVVLVDGKEKLAAGKFEPDNGNIKLFLSPKSMPHTVKKLRQLGWQGTTLAELDPGFEKAQFDLTGNDIDLYNETRQYEGKTYDDWEFPGGSSSCSNNPEVSKKLDRIFGNVLKETAPKKKASAGETSTREEVETQTEEEGETNSRDRRRKRRRENR